MCTVLLPPGYNPIAVNKYIISYHIISYHKLYCSLMENSWSNFISWTFCMFWTW